MTLPEYGLSIKQPWAGLLLAGRKTVEVRSWPTPRRGPIWIHAARVPDRREEAWKWVTDEVRPLTQLEGGVIGIAELVDCRTYATAEQFLAEQPLHLNDPAWFKAPLYGFCFARPERTLFRRFPGNIRFFRIPPVEQC